jgi:hypothetical protein
MVEEVVLVLVVPMGIKPLLVVVDLSLVVMEEMGARGMMG